MIRFTIFLCLAAAIGVAAWYALDRQADPDHLLGYAEADYVRIGPTLEGKLVSLSVERGDEVKAGAPLFAQDEVNDGAARDQAAAELVQAREKLSDLQEGGRAAEILQARADVADMQAAYDRVTRDLARNEAVVASGAVTRQSVEQLRDDARSAQARLEAAKAKLALISDTSGRAHAIAAQQAAVEAAKASLAEAQWRLDQRRAVAPASGTIADTFARPGETIAAGNPVVSLLPPENIRIRFFVPEPALARLHYGDTVRVACDACPKDLRATISFVATAAEYTPPVIYTRGTRGGLVYRIEARPDLGQRPLGQRPLLKPGQPVDVFPVNEGTDAAGTPRGGAEG